MEFEEPHSELDMDVQCTLVKIEVSQLKTITEKILYNALKDKEVKFKEAEKRP